MITAKRIVKKHFDEFTVDEFAVAMVMQQTNTVYKTVHALANLVT